MAKRLMLQNSALSACDKLAEPQYRKNDYSICFLYTPIYNICIEPRGNAAVGILRSQRFVLWQLKILIKITRSYR